MLVCVLLPGLNLRSIIMIIVLIMMSQISVHAADVKSVLRVFSLEVPAREKDDLKEEPIIVRLRKVRMLCVLDTSRSGMLMFPFDNRQEVPATTGSSLALCLDHLAFAVE